jgi:L-serine dehydratase
MAAISIFDIFKIGIGPSSSHTVGPMKAAGLFVESLRESGVVPHRLRVTLHGSLAYTGKGHGTDSAILLGLSGAQPETVAPDDVEGMLRDIHSDREIRIAGFGRIPFDPDTDLLFDFDAELPRHTNGMRFEALAKDESVIVSDDYYSTGGGFVVHGDEPQATAQVTAPPFTYDSGDSLLELAEGNGLSIAELVRRNEESWRPVAEVDDKLAAIWQAMQDCVQRGLTTEGVLPGRMAVPRRAAKLHRALREQGGERPVEVMDWVNAYAIAVNEENAAGGRVVTSPTNGAAGIIPAVLHYYSELLPDSSEEGIWNFLLAAGAIGASISGAEMGCQGEVGVACSMAAGGLAAAIGGSNLQVENAAEIGMEHNLGLTCDPVGGMVQIPCIERNAMGAVKAINAARLALHGDGFHKVSLDQVIATMRQTGLDMSTIYKETSEGGLAVNVPEC